MKAFILRIKLHNSNPSIVIIQNLENVEYIDVKNVQNKKSLKKIIEKLNQEKRIITLNLMPLTINQ